MRDVSKQIQEVANGYHFTKPPAAVEDFMAYVARVLRAVLEWVRDLFQHNQGAMDSRGMSFMLQLAVYLVAAAGVFWLGFVLYKRVSTKDGANGKATKGATAVEELLDAEGWHKQAEKLASGGDYKGACRAVYLSLLQRLHENEIAVFAPAKTNYEYMYTLAKYPGIQSEFKNLAQRVEVIWFGNKEATNADYDQSQEQLAGMDGEIKRIGAANAAQKLTKP